MPAVHQEGLKHTFFLGSKPSLILVIILWHCCAGDWFSWKPNWYGEISLLSGAASLILLSNSLSDTLASMGRRLMGLYDITSAGIFPGFDITSAE
jgi:hypothetical protein